MTAAGDYRHRFRWYTYSLGAAGTHGDREEDYFEGPILWGALEDQSAGPEDELGRDRNTLRARIRFRGRLTLARLDRLIDARSRTWRVESVHHSDTETIVDVQS